MALQHDATSTDDVDMTHTVTSTAAEPTAATAAPPLPSVDGDTTDKENLDRVALRDRQAWILQMRLKFCVQPEYEITKTLVNEDGTINQDYFRPPKSAKTLAAPVRRWTDRERQLLVQGIEKHGIGHFREISEDLLPDWSGNDLRVKTMRLIGRQNLQLYKNWKGDEEAIRREFERNKAIGLKFNVWKNGTLVYDDAGLVLRELESSHSG